MVLGMKEQKGNVIWKKLGIFMATCMAVAMICIPVKVHGESTGTVIPATAKIRSEASTSSAAVGSTTAGKTVSIIEETTGSDGSTWYKIQVDGSTTGYIRSDLVNKSGSSESSSTTAASSSTSSVSTVDSQAATVSTDSANIRSTAATTGSVVASVKKGTAVTITGQAKGSDGKDWYQISFTNNGSSATGFIRSDLVSAGSAATTEVSGTKTSTDATNTDENATDEAATEEGTEGSTEDATEVASEEQPEEQSSSANTGEVTVLNTEETPQLPAGFQEVAVTLNGSEVRAWKNGDFYIFYGQGSDGTEGYYMYDSVAANYQRYFMSNTDSAGADKTGDASGILKPAVIVMAVVLVILLVIITILTIKLNDYRAELEWDDDDYYPEDEEEDEVDFEEEEPRKPLRKKEKKEKPVRVSRRYEEDEEDEDEEEEEEPVRPVPRRKTAPVKQSAPVREVAPVKQAQPVKRKAPVDRVQEPKARPAKPRNFMETDEEEIVRPARKKVRKPEVRPVSEDIDPDDEDTFVFINLDGDDLD